MSARKYYGRLAAAFGGPRWGWLALATGIVLADQGAKAWITGWLPYGASAAAAPFVNLVHLLNEGAAFSLFADAGGEQRYFLTG